MVDKTNLKEKVNSVSELFGYLQIRKLNNHMLNVEQTENRRFSNFYFFGSDMFSHTDKNCCCECIYL